MSSYLDHHPWQTPCLFSGSARLRCLGSGWLRKWDIRGIHRCCRSTCSCTRRWQGTVHGMLECQCLASKLRQRHHMSRAHGLHILGRFQRSQSLPSKSRVHLHTRVGLELGLVWQERHTWYLIEVHERSQKKGSDVII